MAAYRCAEQAGGCGVLWTPQSGHRPVRDPDLTPAWAWCPDCVLLGVPDG